MFNFNSSVMWFLCVSIGLWVRWWLSDGRFGHAGYCKKASPRHGTIYRPTDFKHCHPNTV